MNRQPVHAGQANLVASYVLATQLEEARRGIGSLDGARAHVRAVTELLSDALELIESIADAAETPTDVTTSWEGELDGLSTGRFAAVLDETAKRTAVPEDIAFVACVQLRSKLASLRSQSASAGGSVTGLLEAAASGVRQVLKATAAIEPALALRHGMAPRLDARVLVDRSLAVRRALAAFRAVAVREEAAVSDVVAAFEELRRAPASKHLRPADDAELDRLRARLAEAQHDAAALGPVIADLRTFAEMLGTINARQELVEHDLRALPQVLEQLEGLLREGKPVLRGHLEKIRGLDDRIDAMLVPGRGLDGAALVVELRRAHEERRRAAGAGYAPPSGEWDAVARDDGRRSVGPPAHDARRG